MVEISEDNDVQQEKDPAKLLEDNSGVDYGVSF